MAAQAHVDARENPAARPFIVRFYSTDSNAADSEGRTLDEILAFNDRDLEYSHDYIQVIFPLPEYSPFNPDAPRITKRIRDAFLEDARLRARLFVAFQRIAAFYGFDASGNAEDEATARVLRPRPDFERHAAQTWRTQMNHNHLRISRIIRCLRILGLEKVALAFYNALVDKADVVSSRSLMYWTRAARRPLHLPPDESNEQARGVEWLREDFQG